MPRKLILLAVFTAAILTSPLLVLGQFVGPGSTPPAGGGTLQVDTNYNVGLGTSSASITPSGGVSFGRLFTISSSSNPGFSLLTGTNRYAWYADTASGTLSLAGSTNGSGGNRIFQVTPGGTVYGYDYHSINNQNYYVDPGLSIMPYSALFSGNVGIGTTVAGHLLTIYNNAADGTNVELKTPSVGTAAAGILFTSTNISNGMGQIMVKDTTGYGGTMQFVVHNLTESNNWPAGTTTAMTILPSGNVGIGTVSPGQALEVAGALKLSTNPTVTNDQNAAYFWNQSGVGPTIAGNSFEVQTGGNNSRLRISQGGNVGIGTTTPITAGLVVTTNVSGVGIDVAGNRIQNLGAPVNANDAATKSYVDSSYAPGGSSGNVGGTGTSGYIPKWTGTSTIANSAIFQLGSNIGIGTTAPGGVLHVNTTATTTPLVVQSSNTVAGGYGLANFLDTGSNGAFISINDSGSKAWTIGIPNGTQRFAFLENNNTGPERLSILPGGNVGIGTTAPTTAGLVVSTNVSTVGIDVQNNRIINVGTPINAADAATKSYVDSAITTGVSGGVNGTANYIAKFTGANSVGNSLVYDNGTNVGIGTANPSYKLTVQSSATGTSPFVILRSAALGGGPRAWFGEQSGGDYQLVMQNNAGTTNVSLNTNGYSYLNGGYVGIGTTTPGTNLDVNGNIQSSIYYDRDNTNYYVDPAANTMPYSLNAAGSGVFGGSIVAAGRGDTFMSYLGLDKDYNANNVGLYWNAKWNGDNPSTYNYINTGAWGGTASRLVASGNSLSYDQASGGTNPLTWTNRLTISSSGNVGIGTTGPGAKLDVSGDVYLGHQGTPVSVNSDFGSNGAVLGVNEYYSGGWNLFNTSQYGFQIDFHIATSSTPAVNFNYTAPAANPVSYTTVMSMYPGTGSVGLDLHNYRIQNVGTPINAADAATKSYVDSAIVTGVSGGVTGTTNYIAKFTGANTVGNSLVYDNGSAVGIGVTSFVGSEKLRLNGSIRVDASSAGNTLTLVGSGSNLQINHNGTGIVQFVNSAGGAGYAFPSGYVAIGTTTPATNLDVNGNINASIYYDRDNTGYYLDPAANIMPYALNTGGGINIGGGGTFSGSLAVNGANVTLSNATQLILNSTSSSAIQMNQGSITGVYKLSVNTVDPVYQIGNVNYATYAPDIIGIKTEVFGKATLMNVKAQTSNDKSSSNCQSSSTENGFGICHLGFGSGAAAYSYTIDFNKVERGSDLWLFWQTINEGKDMKDISVYLTPNFDGQTWYELNPAEKQIVIYGQPAMGEQGAAGAPPAQGYEVSYHLVAPRYDSEKWTNYAPSGEMGATLPVR